ncbi:hypothetical protein MF672_019160 [Actinomadura sp. ATCC 31491]|uniref:GAF domain-containing protein n=1 Tax=Actinomadura luzonensis TaxID=2805427 RepID=A0ABT0FU81_9ACTN|nr:hypothetical protein [Actinomadura luzonensis]MCK2215899.1 hypothetical protein [Actinomadura luzonensis]
MGITDPVAPPRLTAPGLRALTDVLAAHDAEQLIDGLVGVAAEICGADHAGLVEVDAVRGVAHSLHVRTPPGDPLGVLRWLESGDALAALAAGGDPVRLDAVRFRVLSVPVPLNTRHQASLWVAGGDFDDHDEEFLVRFATAAGRMLEAHRDLQAAVRLLRAVQAFAVPGAAPGLPPEEAVHEGSGREGGADVGDEGERPPARAGQAGDEPVGRSRRPPPLSRLRRP